MTHRRGTTLVELIVALLLGVVVIGMVADTVVIQRRAERTTAASGMSAAAADEAVHVLASVLARMSAADTLQLRADTALEWFATIGVALSCFASGDSLVVPDAGDGAWWESPPDSSDGAQIADASGAWTSAEIIAAKPRATPGACGTSHRALQLAAARAATDTPLVRVTRRTRFMLYRGGEGDWWLGQRTCGFTIPVHCGSAQPIAGPLASPPAGLRFSLDSTGTIRAVRVVVTAGTIVRTALIPLRP